LRRAATQVTFGWLKSSSFHGRDKLAVAERVDGSRLHKGLLWDGNRGLPDA